MKCGKCPEGRRYAEGSIFCTLYGIIIREDHEGTREGCLTHDGDPDLLRDSEDGTEIQGQRGGTADSLPGVLPGTGKRESVPGLEEIEEGWWF